MTSMNRVAPENKKVRMADVAAAAGVSKVTASKVLSGDTAASTRVSDATRRRIETIAAELGYQRNITARILAGKDRKLDAVIELKVDEAALVKRMEKRVADTIAAGGTVRADDNPESFKKRLVEYREKTAPLSAYYARTGELRTVDGMAAIDDVTRQIEDVVSAAASA